MPIRALHHTLLRKRGGAAVVARMLQEGTDAMLSFEVDDEPDGPREAWELPAQAAEVGAHAESCDVAHIHGSKDLQALLHGLHGFGGAVVITLHDCRTFTAGCVAPLDCEGFLYGCPAPCPRGYDEHAQLAATMEAVREVRPVLIAPSRWMAETAKKAMPDADIRIIHNGVRRRSRRPNKAAAKAALGLTKQAPLVLFAAHGGRGAIYKGGDRWDDMWRGIRHVAPEAVCFFVGGERRQRNGNLFEWPYADEAGMRLFMDAADVFVSPGLADSFSLVTAEAMCAGCAPAAFAVGGLPEQVMHGETGLLGKPGEFMPLAFAVGELLNRPQALKRMSAAAYSAGKGRFDQPTMQAGYQSLYEDVCS